MDYAGFWVRFFAYLVDIIPLLILMLVVSMVMGEPLMSDDPTASAFGIADLVNLFAGMAYFAGFESSSYQATPGKMAVGLIVVDNTGRRLSFPRALGRYFAKIVSAMILLIGFIMVAFTARKQGLHDMIASTLVVRGKPGEVGYDADVFA
ncbi:MAG: RDD family protein [Sphingomonadales bacterium]|nr:RDD family protein [Sphingomonadales bacterium]NCQ20344.1 RDD family protein [Sphingomonadales bacterium]NCT02797.1 RDD family protein [Sphingomonadales bacterium]